MTKNNKQSVGDRAAQLTTTGCSLLIIGILFSSILDGGSVLRVVGVLFIIVAAAMFGASIRLQKEKVK